MAERPMHLQRRSAFLLNTRRERTGSEDAGETRRVDTVVVALIPEYHQVKVRDGDGHLYALTRKTQGVDLAALHEGQRVVCTVARSRHYASRSSLRRGLGSACRTSATGAKVTSSSCIALPLRAATRSRPRRRAASVRSPAPAASARTQPFTPAAVWSSTQRGASAYRCHRSGTIVGAERFRSVACRTPGPDRRAPGVAQPVGAAGLLSCKRAVALLPPYQLRLGARLTRRSERNGNERIPSLPRPRPTEGFPPKARPRS